MGQPAPIPRRSRHLGSAAFSGRSDHGSHASTSAASSRSNRRQGNHNQFQTLKMFPDGHLGLLSIAVFDNYDKAQDTISREAASIVALYRNLSGYPEPTRTALIDTLRRYVEEETGPACPGTQTG